jgi:hypothetical protein
MRVDGTAQRKPNGGKDAPAYIAGYDCCVGIVAILIAFFRRFSSLQVCRSKHNKVGRPGTVNDVGVTGQSGGLMLHPPLAGRAVVLVHLVHQGDQNIHVMQRNHGQIPSCSRI